MAGLRFLEEVLQRAPGRFDITVIGAEPVPAYNRVLLSSLLAGEVDGDDVTMRSSSWYAENGIALVTGVSAAAIDPAARAVVLQGGARLAFDVLVLATGSEPIRLDLPGRDLAGVMTFRSLADIEGLEQAASAGAPAVVIGGGLLGIEAAYGLARRGVPVTLVHLMDRLMERQLDAEGAALLADAIRAKGVRVLLGAQTRAIHGNSGVEAVELADGRMLPCSLVVMAVGIRPSTTLAAASGLQVKRGIVVDDAMQTSVPGIYAIGECAEHRGACYGLVEPCYEQARIAAAATTGERPAIQDRCWPPISRCSGVSVFSAGDFEGWVPRQSSCATPGSAPTASSCCAMGVWQGRCWSATTGEAPVVCGLIRSGRFGVGVSRSARLRPGVRGGGVMSGQDFSDEQKRYLEGSSRACRPRARQPA
jgi:nitrite reductase (NADH) large subunit